MIPDNVPRKHHRDTLLALTAFTVSLLLCIILSPPNVEGVDVSRFSTVQGSKSSLTVEFTPDGTNFNTSVYLEFGEKVHDFSLAAEGYPRDRKSVV